MEQLRSLEFASICEAVTLILLLGIAVPLKHLAGSALAVKVMGPVHGLAFLIYAWLIVQTVAAGGWRPREVALLFLGAMLPFGGFFNRKRIARRAASLLQESQR
ncbi:MAG: DUF3817 domain-containing protein [Roseateles sp.]